MPVHMAYNFSMAVTDGPSIAQVGTLDEEAYDHLKDIVVPAEGSSELEVQPGILGQVKAIFIKASQYTDLTLTIDSGTPIVMDGPIVMVGAGIVALLVGPISTMTFANADTDNDITINVLVIRNAVPPA